LANQLVGTATGQLFSYDAALESFVVVPVPVNGGFLVADSTAQGGWKASSFATRSAWKTDVAAAGAVAVNFATGPNHRIVLGNGAHAITISNPEDGATHKVKLIQPASGAAGTVTLAGATFKPATVTLSSTNSAWNILVMMFDSVSETVSVAVSEEFLP